MTEKALIQFAGDKAKAMTRVKNKRADLHQYRRREAAIAAQIMQDVTGDKGADGKPLYSNEQARKAEAQRREDGNVEMAEIRAHIQAIEAVLDETEIDITYLRDMISIGIAFAPTTMGELTFTEAQENAARQ